MQPPGNSSSPPSIFSPGPNTGNPAGVRYTHQAPASGPKKTAMMEAVDQSPWAGPENQLIQQVHGIFGSPAGSNQPSPIAPLIKNDIFIEFTPWAQKLINKWTNQSRNRIPKIHCLIHLTRACRPGWGLTGHGLFNWQLGSGWNIFFDGFDQPSLNYPNLFDQPRPIPRSISVEKTW